MNKRVVITGYGIITPFGYGDERIRENVFSGKHAFKPITSFDTSGSHTKIGGEAPIADRSYRSFAKYCAAEALKMAQLDIESDRGTLRNALVAVGNLGDGAILQDYYRQFVEDGGMANGNWQDRFSSSFALEPISILDSVPSSHADGIAAMIGSEGIRLAFTNACIASANAMGYGFSQIQAGRTNCALVGGINVLHPKVFYNFDSSRAMADDVVRPFSKHRTGLLIGDGAAILVLEELENALLRGATPLVEMLGWGISSDGFHVSQPEPEGRGLARAMDMALRKANLEPSDIHYVNAHGTGTPLNDRSETKAFKSIFQEQAHRVPMSSTKSMTGHMLEATGAVEAVISTIALLDQRIPPTANYLDQDDELDLDYVTDGARNVSLRTVMSNSSAFGGNNCSLIFRRWDDYDAASAG